jgi:hypothetical protein
MNMTIINTMKDNALSSNKNGVYNNFFLEMHSEEEEARENQLTLSS